MATQFTNQAVGKATVGGTDFTFDSNPVISELFDNASVTLTKAQNISIVVSGGTITYTITITNLSLSPITNFIFEDTIPTGMSYATGTFTVGGVSQTPTIASQLLSYTIASLPLGITIVTFVCNVA